MLDEIDEEIRNLEELILLFENFSKRELEKIVIKKND